MESTVLNQRYQLVELVGAGGMATVYCAQDLLLDRPVAIKFLREPYASKLNFRQRFLEEARAAARLDHPNIVHIYDVGQDDEQRPFIVMELIKGEDLKTLIRQDSPLTVTKALELAGQICAGVGAAHRMNIVHCDLKPQNILVTPEGQIKVADFGIARAIRRGPEVNQTQEKVVWGSPHYISPEQAVGRSPSPASDVYSIGVILYEMLSGVPPFHDPDATTLVMKHLQEDPAPLTMLNPRVPPKLEWLVRKVLSKEPANRYRNADQLGIALEEYKRQGAEMTMPHPPVSDSDSAMQPTQMITQASQRNQGPDWMLWALVAVAAIAVIGLVPLWAFVYQTYTQAAPLPTPATVLDTPTPQSDVEMVSAPNLVGLSVTDAQRLVESQGLQLQVLGEQESNDARPGAILEQTPRAGSQVPTNTTVSVVVAMGRAFQLPDIIGYQLDAVQSGLEDQELLIAKEEIWSTEPKGQILETNPPAGTEIRAGSTVTITISGGADYPIPLQVNFNDQILLEEAKLPQLKLRAGDMLGLTLSWRSTQLVNRSYKVFVHVLTQDLSTLITQQDIEPVNGLRPTNSWTVGETIADPHQLQIPPGTPAGTYQVRVGLYVPEGRMPILDPGQANVVDDTVLVATIEIQP